MSLIRPTGYRLLTPPAAEPLTVEDAKRHLRLEQDEVEEDDWIRSAIKAARELVEKQTRRALITQTWLFSYPQFYDLLEVPKGRLQQIVSIKYRDTNGTEQILDPATYEVWDLSDPARLALARDQSWPEVYQLIGIDPVVMEVTCGYGAKPSDVPEPIVGQLKRMVAAMDQHRSDIVSRQPYFLSMIQAPLQPFTLAEVP